MPSLSTYELGLPGANLSLAPVHSGPDAPQALFVGGIMVRGVREIVDVGGDILVVIRRDALRIDPACRAVSTAGEPAAPIAYPTDGAA